ncbi:unnamed protein product [Cuscuta europaea]|uniref:Uncharacterized protein n=1 Tax=Cuscuta europaea TaxID=41803 RepID=A0A9P1EGB2_CUSEU|nr:unnamed protein product [Cuscuta europaea]
MLPSTWPRFFSEKGPAAFLPSPAPPPLWA